MRPSLRSLGCSAALALLALLGISLWVGMRVGMTAVWERGRPGQDSAAGLPGVAAIFLVQVRGGFVSAELGDGCGVITGWKHVGISAEV